MATVYRNLQGLHSDDGGDANSSRDFTLLNKSTIYFGRGEGINTKAKITSFSVSNVANSGVVTFDLYIREDAGIVIGETDIKDEDTRDADVAAASLYYRTYNKYYLVKGVTIPEGSSVFPLENNIIEFDIEQDLIICIKGTENQKADVILTYE